MTEGWLATITAATYHHLSLTSCPPPATTSSPPPPPPNHHNQPTTAPPPLLRSEHHHLPFSPPSRYTFSPFCRHPTVVEAPDLARNVRLETTEGWLARRPTEEGWQEVQSSRRRRNEEAGRRQDDYVTKFFVTNLPEGCSSRDLSSVFEEYGRVCGVYVARKKDKDGNKFGFQASGGQDEAGKRVKVPDCIDKLEPWDEVQDNKEEGETDQKEGGFSSGGGTPEEGDSHSRGDGNSRFREVGVSSPMDLEVEVSGHGSAAQEEEGQEAAAEKVLLGKRKRGCRELC
ncbi:hypothetical protein L1987_57039 [Smallanthus sonchifolius]|uniref:Uncharacterized protein n=1 Tax=Smallanthus sonchifolius TaxID=185202 RepID=A0ACB9DCE1_9ASTR|nr:hypothetical protein L1987_57039 [Smallanthus sonchifolius]